ncbi:uncharacterized protein LOC132188734 isoform X2 [Corylus avellana]|uniref:uncharacterized protein LOC132188734 isoform X2 n=1 Tax=Corylus avellana TaxID=13451 RepID=UPI00286B418A|nr:uncharacterized protein LOC132188734 isoform X2 [Corylus avellana]
MGGKGRRRREKNYKAAHGGYSRLPPPPKSSQVDALPSKLRKLISFTSALSSKPHGSAAKDDAGDKKPRPKDGLDSGASGIKGGGNDEHLRTPQYVDDSDDIVQSSTNEKRKRKRKSMKVDDLRFETLDNPDTNPKRRERKKNCAVVWKMAPLCLLWCLWLERNARCFEDLSRTLEDLVHFFLYTLFSWTAGWLAPIVINFPDFLSMFSSSLSPA